MIKLLARFGIVGIINTVLDYGIFEILVLLLKAESPIFIFLVSVLSSSIAMINSYILNKKWTFKDTSKKYIQQIIIFFIINLFSIVLNSGTVALLTQITPTTIIHIPSILLTKGVAIVFTMAFNFICYRLWVFEVTPEAFI